MGWIQNVLLGGFQLKQMVYLHYRYNIVLHICDSQRDYDSYHKWRAETDQIILLKPLFFFAPGTKYKQIKHNGTVQFLGFEKAISILEHCNL